MSRFADRILRLSPFHRGAWADLEAHTESAWAARALAGNWPSETRHHGEVLKLVCRPNLDLHIGVAGWPQERLGNLRTDDPHGVLGRALEQGGSSADRLWFGSARLPSVADLATRHADHGGQRVHFSADSMRFLWLDRAQQPSVPE